MLNENYDATYKHSFPEHKTIFNEEAGQITKIQITNLQ